MGRFNCISYSLMSFCSKSLSLILPIVAMPTTQDFGRVSSDFVTGNPISDVNTRLLISEKKKNEISGWKFNRIISRICPSFLFQILWVILEFLFMSLKSPENSKCIGKNMFIYARPCQLRKVFRIIWLKVSSCPYSFIQPYRKFKLISCLRGFRILWLNSQFLSYI